jgi:molybdopterin molybdotransferase
MISVEETLRRLLEPLKPLAAEQVARAEGFGRVLAEPVIARRTQPPAALSAMDGYAVRAADVAKVPARLRVVGAVPAGQSYDRALNAGEAVRIFTGAPLPTGADAIVIQEDTAREATSDRARGQRPAGCPAGRARLRGGARHPLGAALPPATRAARHGPAPAMVHRRPVAILQSATRS